MLIVLFFITAVSAICPPNFAPNGTACTACAPQYESNGTICRKRQTFCPVRRMDTALNCTGCEPEFYISSPCNATSNSVCSACRVCGPNEKEILPCAEFQDRVCEYCSSTIPANSSFSGSCSWRCNDGFYRVNDGCVECDPGHKCVNGTRLLCDSGQYSPLTRASACTDCPSGTFDQATGSTACIYCGVGSYRNGPLCSVCPPGYWSLTVGVTQCSPCAPGSWCNSTSAFSCPPNTTSLSGGASYLDCFCRPGLFGVVTNTSHATCLECSTGSFCNASKCIG